MNNSKPTTLTDKNAPTKPIKKHFSLAKWLTNEGVRHRSLRYSLIISVDLAFAVIIVAFILFPGSFVIQGITALATLFILIVALFYLFDAFHSRPWYEEFKCFEGGPAKIAYVQFVLFVSILFLAALYYIVGSINGFS